MSALGLKLQGQFKLDLHDASGNLIKTSEFIDNFITNSGVMYPYYFAFADCFRFLSIGSGDKGNSLLKNFPNIFSETTGLDIAIPDLSYLGNRNNWDSPDTNYALYPACGYTFSDGGVNLFRQWTLPTNLGGSNPSGVFQSDGTFNEFMVSPGRPYVTGNGGIKFCSCSEYDDYATGLDCSSISEYYSWLKTKYSAQEARLKTCDATAAFARIVYPFNYTSGSILNVTYKLNVSIDTGVNYKSMYFNNTHNTEGNWSGYWNAFFNITQPGVKLINDGQVTNSIAPNGQKRLQHFDYTGTHIYTFANEYGESFVPPHGMPLEPSNVSIGASPLNQNISFYLSDNNSQFLVNPSGGKFSKDTGAYKPWNYTGEDLNISNHGLKPYVNEIDSAITLGSTYWTNNLNNYNIRRKQGKSPNTGDITIADSMNSSYFDATSRSNPNFNLINLKVGLPNSGTRTGQVLYTFNFQNYTQSNVLTVKSFVAAYKDLGYGNGQGDTINLVPFFDAIFSGSGNGSVFIPQITTGIDNFGKTGAYLSGVGSNDYFYLYYAPNSDYPVLNTKLTWSVPCPDGVSGCS